jgi:hypothetical protein
MSTSSNVRDTRASRVAVTEDTLIVTLVDGRSISVPVTWYPRLAHGTVSERSNWRLIGGGQGIHWPALDEDIAIEDLLAGRRSSESPASLDRWLDGRKRG